MATQRYKINLSEEYLELFARGQERARNPMNKWYAQKEGHKDQFVSISNHLSSIERNNATTSDIGILIGYFGHIGQTLEQITDNIKWERI